MSSDSENVIDHDRDDDQVETMREQIESFKKQIEESDARTEELLIRLDLKRERRELEEQFNRQMFSAKARILLAFFSVMLMFLAYLNIIKPEFLERFFGNSFSIWTSFISVVLMLIVVVVLPKSSVKSDTFLDIDKDFEKKSERPDAGGGVKSNVTNITVNGSIKNGRDSTEDFPDHAFGSSSDFEYSITEIVDYLGNHIKLAESKASKLLDKGTTYLRRGLYFYIVSIVLWQVWGHFVSFDGLVIAGMISTSLAFVIIEFLAAWFLKQYRSFVDSSMVYMRVQSFFNRYLLLYYAARDFGGSEGQTNAAKTELLKVLSLEIKWPELKDINSNDFNYMLEAMGSMHTSFEKLKGVFQAKEEPSK